MQLTTHLHPVPRSKNAPSYTSAPQYFFIAWCSVKAQGQLYLYLTIFLWASRLPLTQRFMLPERYLPECILTRDGYNDMHNIHNCPRWNTNPRPSRKKVPGCGLEQRCLFTRHNCLWPPFHKFVIRAPKTINNYRQ
jgi:hypothetical protein